jgi:hypothetical protein
LKAEEKKQHITERWSTLRRSQNDCIVEPGPVLRGLIEKDENAAIDRLHESERKTDFTPSVACSQAARNPIALGRDAILSNGSEGTVLLQFGAGTKSRSANT